MTTQQPEPPAETEVVLPAPRPAKARLLQDGRDMFWSMAPLVVACLVLAGLLGQCSFQPAGPKAGPVPAYDAAAALRSDATTLGFPIRLPVLPEGWQPNSGARDGIDGGRVDPLTGQRVRALISRVGYVTPRLTYVSLTQSNADEEHLVDSLHSGMVPSGDTPDVAGTRWVVYHSGEGTEPVWTTRLLSADGEATQIAVTGTGSADEFRTLAEAVSTQIPLPAK